MDAEIVAVGSELMTGQIANTNAQFLSRRLSWIGINVRYHHAVGDNAERIRTLLQDGWKRSSLWVFTGGLGPTEDDLTRPAVAAFLERPLIADKAMEETIGRGWAGQPPQIRERLNRQAQRIDGAQWLPNRYGTAPGQWIELEDGHLVALLPGPPRELMPMVDEFLVPKLQQRIDTTVFHRFLHVVGLTESEVEDRLFPWLHGAVNPSMATYIDAGEVLVRVSASGEKEIAAKKLEEAVVQAREALGEAVYAVSELPEEGSLVSTVEDLLAARRETLSVAESCTGGLIAKLLTDRPGSSQVFLLGAVTYSNQAKAQILGVDSNVLSSEGAVSEPVARQMAEGVRNRARSTYAIATTGIAGPEGGSPEKPVGLVYTAIATPQRTQVFRDLFRGERDLVRIRAAKMALARLRLAILKQE